MKPDKECKFRVCEHKLGETKWHQDVQEQAVDPRQIKESASQAKSRHYSRNDSAKHQ